MSRISYYFLLFSAIFLIGTSVVENEVINRIVSQLVKFTENSYQEKVYLHTDGDVYEAGEVIWMNARLLEATNHTLSQKSKVVHVQLYDRHGSLLVHEKLRLEEGQAAGDILLPDTLSPGGYQIRAFTLWMQNASEEYFFEKNIYVSGGGIPQKEPIRTRHIEAVKFFPEGGQFVSALENRIAFKVFGNEGKGVDAEGFLINDKSDTLTAVYTYKNGIGSFHIKPKRNREYYLRLVYDGDTTRHQLPRPKEEGVNLMLSDDHLKELKLSLRSSRKFIGDNSRLFVLVQARGKIQFAAAAGVFANYQLTIPKSKLALGVNQLTVFNESGVPLLERLIFCKPQKSSPVSVSGVATTYQRKNPAVLQVNSRIAEEALLTISVHDKDPLTDQNIRNYLLLTSDLEGHVEDPSYYFEQSDSAKYAADLLMMTHRWTRFFWDGVLSQDQGKFEFPAESDGQILTGRLINIGTGEPVRDTMMILSAYNHQPNFVFLRPRENGAFMCTLPDLYGIDVLSVIPSLMGNAKGYRLELFDLLDNTPRRTTTPFEYGLTSTVINIEKRVRKNYRLHDPATFSVQQQQVKRDTFWRAQMMDEVKFELFPADFIQLNDVSEMIFELLPSVKIKKKKGKDHLYVSNATTAYSYKDNVSYEYELYEQNREPAAVFINGVLVSDHSQALELDYNEIEKVEVFNKKDFPSLNKTFHGAVSFTTKDLKEGDQLFRSLRSNEIKFDGYSQNREYHNPSGSEKALLDSRKPDLRHLLYWSANTKLKPNESLYIDFHTSLVEGDFYFKIEGITETGVPIYEIQKFSVIR